MLPICIEPLRELSVSGDDEDRRYCKGILRQLGGPAGYDRMVSAAAVGDGMVVVGKYINLSQKHDDDAAVEGEECARMRHEIRTLFRDGGIWLPQAAGTLTHCMLSAIRDGKVLFFGNPDGKEEVFFGGLACTGKLRAGKADRAGEAFRGPHGGLHR